MAKSTADLMMKFVLPGRKPIWAESAIDVVKGAPFMEGFKPISEYSDYSNFFEITNFSFNVALKPQDQGVGVLAQAQSGVAPAASDQFSSWRNAAEDKYRDIHFPPKVDTFTFTRAIDGASPIFFSACCNQHSFAHASLVRRVSTGQLGGPEMQAQGFLRIDFKDVLLVGINWSDGELVTESCTFICKAMRVRYRQHWPGASPGPERIAIWNQDKDGKASDSAWED